MKMDTKTIRPMNNIHIAKEQKQNNKNDKSVEFTVRAYNLDLSTPLDLQGWMNNFGDKDLYFRLLPKFEDNGFLENLFHIAYWVQVGNFYEMKEKGHAIKGSSAYAGASRISNDWYWIQVYFEKREYVNMMKHYLDLLEHSAQFRIYWRMVYFKYLKQPYVPSQEHEVIPLPVGYSLKKVGEYEFKLSYPDDYLELAKDAELRGKKYIVHSPGVYDIEYTNDEEVKEVSQTIEDNIMLTAQGEWQLMECKEKYHSEERISVYHSFSNQSFDLEDIPAIEKKSNKTIEHWLIVPHRKNKLIWISSFKSNWYKTKENNMLDDENHESKTLLLIQNKEIGHQNVKLKSGFANKKKNIKSYELGNLLSHVQFSNINCFGLIHEIIEL